MAKSLLWPDRRVKPPFGVARVDWGHPLARGLVGEWLFNEGGGKYALDIAGTNTGTLINGLSRASGRAGGALKFDGASEYVNLSNSVTLQPVNYISIVFWMNTLGNNSDGTYAPQFFDTNNNSWGTSFQQYSTSHGLYWTLGSNTNKINFPYVFDAAWHQIGLTYDGAYMRLYIDAVLGQSAAATGTITWTTDPLLVGARKDFTSTYFVHNTFMDDFRIYNRALSASEVQQAYLEPFSHLRPIKRRFYSIPSGGVVRVPWHLFSRVGGS
jgi:hypothetical protein